MLRWSVAPERRRQGLGAELLRALERRLLALGVRDISMIVPGSGEATETARAAGYAQHEGVLYLEKRRLHTTSSDDRVDELGGQWLTEELWQSIGGMEREKELIERRVILPLAEREEAKRHGVVAASAVDPLRPARHRQDDVREGDVAGRLGWPFVEVFPSQLVGTDAHGRAGALRELFDQLLYLDSVVVFIDEVEEIASSRQTRPRRTRSRTSC